ncbi:hypothetical protein HPB51_013042 [Rhipicephalus microplus]|uniref:Uncharacterized protein n=1 Tax=Rhipicephalus microplus TaxID=6941 RepID=A0A9J6F455_RHIMP|nr:hypothetical protein HPB51_013042 [Rhipicephalus microplus]
MAPAGTRLPKVAIVTDVPACPDTSFPTVDGSSVGSASVSYSDMQVSVIDKVDEGPPEVIEEQQSEATSRDRDSCP